MQPLSIEPGGGVGGVGVGTQQQQHNNGAASATGMQAGLTGAFPRSASAARLAAAGAAEDSRNPLRDEEVEDDASPRPGGG